MHMVWTLPDGDTDFSVRWGQIKARFTYMLGQSAPRSASKWAKRERGIWQRRFWEHAIRDRNDFEKCVAYCWSDPVRHGHVESPQDWQHSSIHREVRDGKLSPEWSCPPIDGEFGEAAGQAPTPSVREFS